MDHAWAVGLPRGSRPYVVTMQQAFTLALINARVYQLQLENLYTAALNVTLQRFAFEPQFYAGMTPADIARSGIGFPESNPLNRFLYQTRRPPAARSPHCNWARLQAIGKLFSSGGQLLMGFANQIVFNFVGKNPIQPTVQSSLPLSFVQPFLRGGGRAVVLETLTQAERNLLYQVRIFAKFRQEFIVDHVDGRHDPEFRVGFNLPGFSTGGNTDPTIGFIPVVQNLAQVDIDRRNVAYFEQLANLYEQLIEGESSGLSRLQVDQVRSNLVRARSTLVNDILTLRNTNDQLKQQLGLPPDTPMMLDISLMQPYLDVFRRLMSGRAPEPKAGGIDRSSTRFPSSKTSSSMDIRCWGCIETAIRTKRGRPLEETLQAAVRIALEYRLDLMNTAGQPLRRLASDPLQGQCLEGHPQCRAHQPDIHASHDDQPVCLLQPGQAVQPGPQRRAALDPGGERNNFRQAIIAYQQAGRALQNQEDFIKNQLRSDLRSMRSLTFSTDQQAEPDLEHPAQGPGV